MFYAWWKWLRDRRNRLWVTPMGTAVLAVLLAFASKWIGSNWRPSQLPDIQPETIDALLTVIATSMLAVATFSLGILASALANASSSATPRATELLMGDRSARDTIGGFMAAFVYAMVAKVALSLGFYGPSGHFILFVSTLAVLVYLVVRLLLWVRTLSTLGLVGDSVGRLQSIAGEVLQRHRQKPHMGARAEPALISLHGPGVTVFHQDIGFLRHLNLQGLQDTAKSLDAQIHVLLRPGAFVDPHRPLARVELPDGGPLPEDCVDAIRAACLLGRTRSFDQDPRFGLIALSEVAQRALSAAVNDSGTAIHVLSALTTVLLEYQPPGAKAGRAVAAADEAGPEDLQFDRLTLPAIDAAEFVSDSFAPIARDGADKLEVGLRLQKMLALLAATGSPALAQAARLQASLALQHAELALRTAHELQSLKAEHTQLFGTLSPAHEPRKPQS